MSPFLRTSSQPWLKPNDTVDFSEHAEDAVVLAGGVKGGTAGQLDVFRALFVADRETHFAALQAFETPELLGDEWPDRP